MKRIFENPLIVEYFKNDHIGTHNSATSLWLDINVKYFQRDGIYHNNVNHIEPMLRYFAEQPTSTTIEIENQFIGFFFALFHDVKTIPEAHQIMNSIVNMHSNRFGRLFMMVHEAIQATTYTFENIENLQDHVKYCVHVDVKGLNSTNPVFIINQEQQIFKEYSNVDYRTFVEQRKKVLLNIYKICNLDNAAMDLRFSLIDMFQPRIAVFAGSFDPFHAGHYNVLKQAEHDFDKVIVAIGTNSDKSSRADPVNKIREQLPFNEVIGYTCLLSDYLASLAPLDVTLIRGLRNGQDLQYEQNIKAALHDMDKQIRVAYYLCDAEHSHVSSTLIRDLHKHKAGAAARYLNFEQ